MPHITIQMLPGHSESDKRELANRILKDVVETFHLGEDSVSIAMEEVPSKEWAREVYDPQIQPNMDRLYKKPGYARF